MSRRCKRHRWYARLGPELVPVLRRVAREVAGDDLDLCDDLVQEGRVAVWRLEPHRLALARSPRRLARRVGLRAMFRWWYRECERHGPRIPIGDSGWSLRYVRRAAAATATHLPGTRGRKR